MADNNKTVQLDVAVSTSGAEGVRKLATDVELLAKSGGDAAPEFQRLAAELNKLAAQADAVESLSRLGDEVRQLGIAETEAREKSALLAADLKELAIATRQQSEAEQVALAAVRSAKVDLDAKREALTRLRIETDADTKGTAEYADQVKVLRLAILDARNAERDATEVRRLAGAATKTAQDAERALQTEYRASAGEVQKATDALSKRKAVLDQDRAALEADGVATENLAAAQGTLLQAYAEITQKVEQLQTAQTAAAQSARDQIRLDQQVAAGKRELAAAAQAELAAEKAAYGEAVQLAERLAAAEKTVADQARAVGTALQAAFTQTGVRSATVIREEINQIGASLIRLKNNTSVSGEEFDRAFTSATHKVEKLKLEIAGVSPAIAKASASTNVFGEALRSLTAIYGGFQLATSFYDANTQMENLRRTLTLVTGSSQTAAQQIDYLRKVANDSGVAVGSIASEYSRFVASATSSGISLEVVNRTFAAVTKSAGLLGLSSEDTGAALNALGQSASKGKVSLEELQQQLGDRLPAVLATTAKGLGITTAQLTKLVETGKLAADNTYFIAFASGIEQTFLKAGTSVEGLQAQMGRFKNALNEAFVEIGNSGVVDALTSALKLLAPVISDTAKFTVGLGKAMGEATGFVIGFGKSVLTLDFKGASANVKTFRQDIDELNERWFGAPTRAQQAEAVKLMKDLGISYSDAVEKVKANTAAQAAQSAALAKTTASTTAASDAQKLLAGSSDAATIAVKNGTANSAQIAVYYDNLIAQSKARIKSLEEEVLAVKKNGEASVELATIGGNEIEVLKAQANAANANAKAINALAVEKKNEATLSLAEVEALRKAAEASGSLTEARKKELETLKLKGEALDSEGKKSAEAAALAEAEALKRKILVETYGDQSAGLDKLKEAYDKEVINLKRVADAEKVGQATKEDVRQAQLKLTEAEALYHDALDDTVKALERKQTALKSNADILQATLNVQKATLQQEIDLAKLNGDSYTVLVKTIEQKELDIKIIQAKVAAQRAEAAATIAVAEATKAELEAEGKLTPEKRALIDATIASAKVKQLEADATEKSIAALQKGVENLKLYGTETNNAASGNQKLGGSFDSLTTSTNNSLAATALAKIKLGEYITSAEAAALSLEHLGGSLDSYATKARNAQDFSVLGKNTDKDGFSTDSSGNRIGSSGQVKLPDGASFDTAQFQRDSEQAARSGGNLPDPNNPRYIKGNGGTLGGKTTTPTQNPNYNSEIDAFQKRLDEINGLGAAKLGGTTSSGTTSSSSDTSSASQKATGNSVTNIHLDGKKIGTLSLGGSSDVSTLTNILSQLTNTAARTSA